MDKGKIENLIRKHEEGEISSEELKELETALEAGEVNLEDFKTLSGLDLKMNFQVPEPGPEMRNQFYLNLEMEKEKLKSSNFLAGLGVWLSDLGWKPSTIQLAYSILLIVVGIAMGTWINGAGKADQKIDALTEQVTEMRQMMMLTLLKDQMATQRLKAVNLAMEAKGADEKVIDALLNTLNNDENVNVRLATIDVLVRYAENPNVRKGLVEAIPNQSSSTIQYALAEAMVAIGEKSSVKNLKDLLNDDEVDQGVKDKIKESIQKLI